MDPRARTPLTPLYSRDPSPVAAGNPSTGSGGFGGTMSGLGAMKGMGAPPAVMGVMGDFGAPPDAMAVMGGMNFASLMGGMGAPSAVMGGMSFDVPTHTHSHEDAVEELANTAGASRDAVRDEVVLHYPEDFFVLLSHQHHRDLATSSSGRFSHGGLDFHTANWRPEANTDLVEAYYHVHMCTENLSLNAWCDEVATQVLNHDTFLHYFDVATVKR
ncbi:hypothetical protein D1007_26463 [Hordeum vulgare]|nr:hypothetical protein D1007_26463 [Hordeum vulgare]